MHNAKINLENFSSSGESNPGLQIQSQLCLPLDQGLKKKCLKIPKFTDQVFKNVDFSHFLIIKYQSNPYQKLKKCPNNIVINFSVK